MMGTPESKQVVKELYAAFGCGDIGWSRGRVKSTGRMFDNRWVMAFSVRDG